MKSYQGLRQEIGELGKKIADYAALRSQKESLEALLQAAHTKLSAFQEQIQAGEARLQEANALYRKSLAVELDSRRAANTEAQDAKDKMNATLGEFADLKERLAVALARVAEMEGYVRRVRDEDRVTGRATQGAGEPKTEPAGSYAWRDGPRIYGVDMARDGADRTVHWTSYGQRN